MKILQISRLIILILFFSSLYSQSRDTLYIFADSLAENSIDVVDPWRFKSGDSIEWASPDYDHSNWMTINSRLSYEEKDDTLWKGIGWFRKILVIDSSLHHESIAFRLNHFGASDIFLNGKL